MSAENSEINSSTLVTEPCRINRRRLLQLSFGGAAAFIIAENFPQIASPANADNPTPTRSVAVATATKTPNTALLKGLQATQTATVGAGQTAEAKKVSTAEASDNLTAQARIKNEPVEDAKRQGEISRINNSIDWGNAGTFAGRMGLWTIGIGAPITAIILGWRALVPRHHNHPNPPAGGQPAPHGGQPQTPPQGGQPQGGGHNP